MTDLQALVERIEAASGPDREIDALIHEWAYPVYAGLPGFRYTGSLDATIALMEGLRPDWYWRLMRPLPSQESAMPHSGGVWATCGPAGAQEEGFSNTPPLALLTAFLRALISQPEGEDR